MTGPPARRSLFKIALEAWHRRIGRRTVGGVGHHATAPQDRIPFSHKLAYGAGAFSNNLFSAAIGGMLIVLNLGLGMNPALVGLVAALPRFTDFVIDPIMGFISDHTRSRWGRRRPYIFVGAIVAGVTFALLWQVPRGQGESFYFWWFVVGSNLFYVAYTVFAAPWVGLGYELTPDYHERTRLMGVQNFLGQIVYTIAPWFLWFMTKPWFADQVEGAGVLAIGIGVVAAGLGILPALFLRERFQHAEKAEKEAAGPSGLKAALAKVVEFGKAFGSTLSSRPFMMLCIATFLVFNSFILISAFQSYVIIFYVFGGDQLRGAEYVGLAGTAGSVSGFGVIVIVTWLATRIGKRKAFFVSTGISMVGYALKWFCYSPAHPWLVLVPTPLMAFGLGGLFTLMGSMIADVVDVDEITTHQRREGMFGAVFWWVVKAGLTAALAGGGYLLNATGFDVALGGGQAASTITQMRLLDAIVPFVASGIAIWAIYKYPITEAAAHEVRAKLEARRGAVAAG